MNNMYNTSPTMQANNMIGLANFNMYQKKTMMSQGQPESLVSMALYDFVENFGNGGSQQPEYQPQYRHASTLPTPRPMAQTAAFHPVDEYKDLSLKEILDLSDDFLFDDRDMLASAAAALEPTPIAPTSGLNIQFQGFVPPVSPDSIAGQRICHVQNALPEMRLFGMALVETSPKKRTREDINMLDLDDDEDEFDENGKRFRPYQTGQWSEKFEELCQYRAKFGHCLVPHTYHENLPLARWVKRQRYQMKLMNEQKSSTMTEERVEALEAIGFVWDSQGAAWGERLAELREFKDLYMHCNVPSNYSENPQLATWVKCQRRQRKLFSEGKASNMTADRIAMLEALGFEWELRAYKRAKTC